MSVYRAVCDNYVEQEALQQVLFTRPGNVSTKLLRRNLTKHLAINYKKQRESSNLPVLKNFDG